MKPQNIEAIMVDIADGDPLDFGDLSVREDDVRALMATHLCEVDRQLAAAGLAAESRLEFMTAIAAHALVENMLLNLARLRRAGSDPDFREWLKKYRLSG